jgi:hypothetical protein
MTRDNPSAIRSLDEILHAAAADPLRALRTY